jgi:hypothetical protein
MNSLLFPELNLFQEKTDMTTDKKAIRTTIKRVIDLHNQEKISDGVLRAFVELAMAYEITTGLDKKLTSKEKALYKKLR